MAESVIERKPKKGDRARLKEQTVNRIQTFDNFDTLDQAIIRPIGRRVLTIERVDGRGNVYFAGLPGVAFSPASVELVK